MTNYSPVFTLLVGLVIGLLIGGVVAIPFTNAADTEQSSVSCTAFTDESGEASGMCFVSGDVKFEWLNENDRKTANGTVELSALPVDNSTVRRET
jgi:hypothetical protein